MAVYQVSVVFEAETDEKATAVAERISKAVLDAELADSLCTGGKIAFTKFEQEAPEVADKPVV